MRVHAKWGFGNAPLKPHHRERAIEAIHQLLRALDSVPDVGTADQLEAISYVKGQFTRTTKQDQWDWFTVWELLGRPSRSPASKISKQLGDFRSALKDGQRPEAERIRDDLITLGIERYLRNFLEGGQDRGGEVSGFVYILSTREQPGLLKIGMTRRSVLDRSKEINSATGVAIPFGVRASWCVDEAVEVERDIHALLAPWRVRTDREFFEIDYNDASRLINDYLNERRRIRSKQDEEPNHDDPQDQR